MANAVKAAVVAIIAIDFIMCSFPLVVDVWQIAFALHLSTVVVGELGARRELVIYLLTNHNIAFSYV